MHEKSDDVTQVSAGQSSLTNEKITEGQAALARLHDDQTFAGWCKVGAALQVLRAEVLREVHANRPEGKAYNAAFGTALKRYEFDSLDSGDRTRLFAMMDNLSKIETWRNTLRVNIRLTLNHPSSVLRRWRAATEVSKPKQMSAYARLQAAHAETLEKLHRAEREIERGGGDLWTKDDRPEDIATVMVATLPASKAERVGQAILRLLSGRQKPSSTVAADNGNRAVQP